MVLSLDFRQHLLYAAGRRGKRYRGERNQAQTAPWSHAKKCQLGFWRLVQVLLGIYDALCLAVTPSLLGYIEQQVCWEHQH